MSEKVEIFLNKSKIQQIIVHFACRVPIRRELSLGEKKALENVLKDLDRGFFQIFEEPLQKNPMCLFQVIHQIPIGAITITLPSFVFSNESFSFIYPVKIFDKNIPGVGSIDASDVNKKMLDWILKLQEIISNLNCQRTGKIFELVIGPFTQSEKIQLFKELLSIELADVGELNLTFAKYHTQGADVFNIQTNIRYLQLKLGDDFIVSIRVDINNQVLSDRMEPSEIEKVWKFADAVIDGHLKDTLVI